MCGRFFLDAKNRELERYAESLPPDSPPVKSGEVFPTDIVPVLTEANSGFKTEAMSWGFPRFDGKGVIFNARCETALEKPMFRKALLKHPAVIPVSGFYEWRKIEQDKKKEKIFFSNPENGILYLAGIWNLFPHKEKVPCFTILTTEANESVKFCHGRMPLILAENEWLPWLHGKNRDQILAMIPMSLRKMVL